MNKFLIGCGVAGFAGSVICALAGIAPGYDMREELNDHLPQWRAAPDSALRNTNWPVGGRTPTDPALLAGCARLRGISR